MSSVTEKLINQLYYKLDDEQKLMYESIHNHLMVCVNSRAGTGKTYVSVLSAMDLLLQGKVNKIYYIRFPDDRSLRLGFLPGNTEDKEYSYMAPFLSACYELDLSPAQIEEYCNNHTFELTTDISLRGTNIDKACVIIDEAQNARLNDLKLVLTRIKDNCKVFLIGHSGQYDNYKGQNDRAFEGYLGYLKDYDWVKIINLTKNYRGKISTICDNFEGR